MKKQKVVRNSERASQTKQTAKNFQFQKQIKTMKTFI